MDAPDAADPTGYVQWFLDRGLPVPGGIYRCAALEVPGDYITRARASGRDPDGPEPGTFWLSTPDLPARIYDGDREGYVLLCGWVKGDGGSSVWIFKDYGSMTVQAGTVITARGDYHLIGGPRD